MSGARKPIGSHSSPDDPDGGPLPDPRPRQPLEPAAEPPFGAFAPTPHEEWARGVAARLPVSWAGKRLRLVCWRLAGGKSREVADVEVFAGQRARLHLRDNVSEKRAYCAPQFWETAERACLAEAIAAPSERPFNFLDVGANVGLFSLYARSVARGVGRAIRIACVEPSPIARARLAFNIAASAADEVSVFPWAATRERGTVALYFHARNVGGASLIGSGEHIAVEGRPLAEVIDAAGFGHVDALKIDIEGAERPALEGLFAANRPDILPRLIVAETCEDFAGSEAIDCCTAHGYAVRHRSEFNSVLVREA